MRRKTSNRVIELNKPILEAIKLIKSEHPFWGYRRVWATLRYHKNLMVNKKRVYGIMKSNNLLVKDRKKLKATRTPRSKPIASKPNEIWGIDMTKVKTQSGWAYLVMTIDWYTKKIVGHSVSYQSKSEEWLEALEEGLLKQWPDKSRGKSLSLVSDNGCQPTSQRFMKSCHLLGVNQIFTSYNNPKGNADTERLMRTCKEELIWLREWEDVDQVKTSLDIWVESYNNEYLHSSLGYIPPTKYEEKALKTAAA